MTTRVLTNRKPFYMIVAKDWRLNKNNWFSVALFVPGIIILIIGIIGCFVQSELISRILIITSVVLFTFSVFIIGLKYSNFFEILHIHNPIAGLPATSIATVLAVWAIFAGMFFIIPSISDLAGISNKLGAMGSDIKEILRQMTAITTAR